MLCVFLYWILLYFLRSFTLSLSLRLRVVNWLDWKVSKPSGSSCFCLLVLGIQVHTTTSGFLYGHYRFKLMSSCLHSKHFTHWAFSPALLGIFYPWVKLPCCYSLNLDLTVTVWPWSSILRATVLWIRGRQFNFPMPQLQKREIICKMAIFNLPEVFLGGLSGLTCETHSARHLVANWKGDKMVWHVLS